MRSDADLMKQVQAGRHILFEELVRRYRRRLLRFAESKLGDRESAEDAVQETLLAVFVARHTYHPRFAFSTWIYTILLNVCRRQGRAARKSRLQPAAIATGSNDRNCRETPLDQLLRSEESASLAALLNRLPEAEADALRLRFFSGLPYEEIALSMRSSVSGAKARVRRGLQRLAAECTALREGR